MKNIKIKKLIILLALAASIVLAKIREMNSRNTITKLCISRFNIPQALWLWVKIVPSNQSIWNMHSVLECR